MPVIESLAEELGDRARFVKVHVDREGVVGEQFDSSGLPSYLVFKDGVEVDRVQVTFLDWWLRWRLARMVNGALD